MHLFGKVFVIHFRFRAFKFNMFVHHWIKWQVTMTTFQRWMLNVSESNYLILLRISSFSSIRKKQKINNRCQLKGWSVCCLFCRLALGFLHFWPAGHSAWVVLIWSQTFSKFGQCKISALQMFSDIRQLNCRKKGQNRVRSLAREERRILLVAEYQTYLS